MPHSPNHNRCQAQVNAMRITDHTPQLSKQLSIQTQPDDTDDTNIKQQQQ
jgi:hypothetical protein